MKIKLRNSIEILEVVLSEFLKRNSSKIKSVKQSCCSGSMPSKYVKKGKDNYATWKTLEVKIDFSTCNVICIETLQKTLEKIERLSGWECDGFIMRKGFKLNFNNYYFLEKR